MQQCAARTTWIVNRVIQGPNGFASARSNCKAVLHALSKSCRAPTGQAPVRGMSSNIITSLPSSSTRIGLRSKPANSTSRCVHQHAKRNHRAFIALGSNLGDRVAMIEESLLRMEASGTIKVLRASKLYETKAMYVLEQDKFVNGVCEIETSLSPLDLLDELQSVEIAMGRIKLLDKGPRNIDLDVLLYDDVVVTHERLQIPHKLMLEREFVLRPLCDLIPHEHLPRSLGLPAASYHDHLTILPVVDDPVSPLTPLAQKPSLSRLMPTLASNHSHRSTQIMSIVNITPDSFSDGGKHFNANNDALKETIRSHIRSGATILDLGGQSTRPGAVQVHEAEELSRILPVIELIRSLPEAANVAISVDTYRSVVASRSIRAGADIVNDVSAGLMDHDMLTTVAGLGCTICLMHMRGTPETMNKLTSYPDGVVETVGRELVERVRAAEAAGIRPWRIILDPGIGFAKTEQQNLELLRRLGELRHYRGLEGLPWLVGTSRKAFIGHITSVKEAKDRTWGTAAAVTAAIQGGADIIRVHDVREMTQVAKLADAIWRT